MVRNQEKYFKGLNFTKTDIAGGAYKDRRGRYYMISHFGSLYSIEIASNKSEAEKLWFEDGYVFDDDDASESLMNKIRGQLSKCAAAL